MSRSSPFTLPGAEPLREAESQCLEVLLTRFQLHRDPSGALELVVRFDDDTPTIRQRFVKQTIRHHVPDFERKANELQDKLVAFTKAAGAGAFPYNDPQFPFRFCSGGGIPVVSMAVKQAGKEELKDYYCFRWRDIYPVGWNLANGGSETRSELLYPDQVISRELREEMLVFWPFKGKEAVRGRLSFDDELCQGHPDDELAWRLWNPRLTARWDWVATETVPLMFLDTGPDRLQIHFDDRSVIDVAGILLNINALDNGIEVDRVVKMHLPAGAIICDGEIIEGKLLNSVMAMFETSRFNRALRDGSHDFRPDRFFFDGRVYERPEDLEDVIKEFLQEKNRMKIRAKEDVSDYAKALKKKRAFDLCPATRTALERCVRAMPESKPGPSPADTADVFISFASEDEKEARDVFNYLEKNGFHPFLSAVYRDGSDFSGAIDDALHHASSFVSVVASVDHLRKRWLQYESGAFKVLFNRGDKPGGLFLTYASGIDPNHLPLPYARYTVVSVPTEGSRQQALETLLEFLKKARVPT